MSRPVFSGHLYVDGRFIRATVTEKNEEREIRPGLDPDAMFKGTAMPELVNGHTHLGDSFVNEEPPLSLEDSVGPGGFKHRKIEAAEATEIIAAMRKNLDVAWRSGSGMVIDFREGGKAGATALRNASKGLQIKVKVMGRPATREEADEMVGHVDGFGMSSLADHDYETLSKISELSRRKKKTFGIHFSERERENIDSLVSLKPSMVVHGIFCKQDELKRLRSEGIPICITPRSNVFYGLYTDYSAFFREGVNLCIGTDNGMANLPDMFCEMASLFMLQRGKNRISPENIIRAGINNPIASKENKRLYSQKKRYLLLENEFLSPYEVVVKGGMLKKRHIYIV